MAKFGFKEISPSNWLERDDVLKGFVRISPEGQVRPITSDDYLRDILKPKLLESVPTDVQALFEVARGAMAYGYFFYPLYTLAAEQLFRVAETAIAHKSKTLGGVPKSNKTFEKRIDWLVDREVIPNSERVQWDAIRRLRNIASHPEYQSILTPGNAIDKLENIARQINSLFGSAQVLVRATVARRPAVPNRRRPKGGGWKSVRKGNSLVAYPKATCRNPRFA